MYRYNMVLQPAARSVNLADIPDIQKYVDSASSYFNERSLTAANPKKIVSAKVVSNSIYIELLSSNVLENKNARRALRVFVEYFKKESIIPSYNRKIFLGCGIPELSQQEEEKDEVFRNHECQKLALSIIADLCSIATRDDKDVKETLLKIKGMLH